MTSIETCVYCPRLCRHTCPVTHVLVSEAATPTAMLTAALLLDRKALDGDIAVQALTLCTECGACASHCKVNQPVVPMLRQAQARSGALPRTTEALATVEGGGSVLAIQCDDRVWHEALAARLGQPVAVLRTTDHLGAHQAPAWADDSAARLRLAEAVGDRTVVSSCGRCQRALEAAQVSYQTLRDLIEMDVAWSPDCQSGLGVALDGLPACCGGRGPLIDHHPEYAAELARDLAGRLPASAHNFSDCACRAALRAVGMDGVNDPVDWLLTGWSS